MYKVYCDDELIYDTTLDDKRCVIFDAKLDLELNKAGSFTFTIYPNHISFGNLQRLKSIITVYQNDDLIFRGRILNTTGGFHNEKQVLCEGELAFLCDSIQKPYDFETESWTTVEQFLQFLIARHDAQMDECKQFKVGNVTVESEDGYIQCSSSDYPTTWDSLNDKLVNELGGYLWVRHESDGNYIDYLSDFDTLGNQPIKFGKNLLSLKREIKGEDIATALIPFGTIIKEEEGEEGEEENTVTRITVGIEEVNNGVDYIYNAEAVEKYGWIFKTERWDNIESQSVLLRKATERLAELSSTKSIIEISAADLSNIEDFDAFRLGTYVTADSSPHELNENFIVKKLQITLAKPSTNKLTLDGTFERMSDTMKQQANALKTAASEYATNEQMISLINQTRTLIKQTDESIKLEVSAQFDDFQKSTTAALELKVGRNEKNHVVSMINGAADAINLTANRLNISSATQWNGKRIFEIKDGKIYSGVTHDDDSTDDIQIDNGGILATNRGMEEEFIESTSYDSYGITRRMNRSWCPDGCIDLMTVMFDGDLPDEWVKIRLNVETMTIFAQRYGASFDSAGPSISYDLRYCTSTNDATSVSAGSSFSTTIVPIYNLDEVVSISVTMDNVDITSDVVNGNEVTIPVVRGDVTITAVAEYVYGG